MFLTYNGVELSIEHVVSYEQTPVYDPSGVDYLYTHHRISVRSVWNPAATTDIGSNAAATAIESLRATLMTPRGVLEFSVPGYPNTAVGTQPIIISPQLDPNDDRYPCDANNGPKPVGEPIITICGNKTAIVEFTVETWVNDCAASRPILSDRWEMSQDIDEDCYTTRTVTGTAIFRTDWLASRINGPLPASPDDFRGWLAHPIPNNFKRTRISVRVSSDNTTLQYSYVDVEQPSNIRAGFQRVTRIAVTVTSHEGVSTMNPLRAGQFAFPRRRLVFNIRVWGRRTATRADLGNAIAQIGARFRLNGATVMNQFIPAFFWQETSFVYDAYNRYMECRADADASGIFARLTEVAGVGPFSFDGDPTSAEPVVTTANGPTSNPTHFGTRGTWLQRCVAQVLSEPCTTPAEAPDQTEVLPTILIRTPG